MALARYIPLDFFLSQRPLFFFFFFQSWFLFIAVCTFTCVDKLLCPFGDLQTLLAFFERLTVRHTIHKPSTQGPIITLPVLL